MGPPKKIQIWRGPCPCMDNKFEKGDTILIKGSRKDHLVTIDGGMCRLSDPRGAFDTGRLIGTSPGDELKIGSARFLLHVPDVLDHLMYLNRGPQMIIPKDSSRIVMGLGLSNGSKVLEGGAGSGALSIAILNSIGDEGKLITYDIRKDHLEKAGANIERAGLSSSWEGKLGNVYDGIQGDGFDAFVVDVPEPEKVVKVASKSLRSGGRFCSYVPTFNQMERAVIALRGYDFSEIKAIEIIERGFSVKDGATRPVTEMLSHTGFLVFGRWYPSP